MTKSDELPTELFHRPTGFMLEKIPFESPHCKIKLWEFSIVENSELLKVNYLHRVLLTITTVVGEGSC